MNNLKYPSIFLDSFKNIYKYNKLYYIKIAFIMVEITKYLYKIIIKE